MLSVLSVSALCVSSVLGYRSHSNALNRASARYYEADDYYYADAEYDYDYDEAYIMYEEAADNLERAEREFELMQQMLDGGGFGDVIKNVASMAAGIPSADLIKGYLEVADKGLDVGDKGRVFFGNVASDIKHGTVSKRAVILDARPKGQKVQSFSVYNTLSPIKVITQFKFATAPQKTVKVYCPGFGGMTVYPDNKPPGWGLDRDNVYVYDGQSFDNVGSVADFQKAAAAALTKKVISAVSGGSSKTQKKKTKKKRTKKKASRKL